MPKTTHTSATKSSATRRKVVAKRPPARARATAKASRSKSKTTQRRSQVGTKPTVKQRKGLLHHGKRLYHLTPKFVHGMIVGALVGVVIVSPLGFSRNADALTIQSAKDCDSYSIINCGVQSTASLKKIYSSNAYVRHVFNYYKISTSDVNSLGKTAVKGTVYRNGDVKVNGKVVAKGAITQARKRVTGKDKKITYKGSTFYQRHISTSWSHTSAPAFVVLNNGVFEYAVLAPCGNTVIATSVKKPAPPKPVLTCDSLTRSLLSDKKTYQFNARASAQHTTITSYVFHFGDGSRVTKKTHATAMSVRHTYPQDGRAYRMYVTVNSTDKTNVTSGSCTATLITASPVQIAECRPGVPEGSPQCSAIACTGLTETLQSDKSTYGFMATARTVNTSVASYVFDFGDGETFTENSSANSALVTHIYPHDGKTYRVTVMISSTTGGVPSAGCAVTFITATPQKPAECKPGVPEGSTECARKKPIIIQAASVKELPDTGPTGLIVIFVMSMIGGIVFHKTHHHVQKRRRRRAAHHHTHPHHHAA